MASAQVSVYGIGAGNLDAAVEAALDALGNSDVPYETSGMATVIDAGSEVMLFDVLRAMYESATQHGEVVMVATISNACPVTVQP